ncbi:MAG: inorganic diphosphatase [Candidatus Aenigmarchaeota archaeon]|nr:inorganic diphosphatase [Candidatus Aenigmarchaeota archaeon]
MSLPLWRTLEPGPKNKFPDIVHVIVEVPKNSNIKYEMDKETGAFFVDRDLFTSMVYPGDYGSIPQTIADDGDPVDALVLVSQPHMTGIVIRARPIGILRMEDEHGKDDKIICVPINKIDPKFRNYKDIKDLPTHIMTEIKHFFNRYKELEPGKWIKLERMESAENTKKFILKSVERYKREYQKE